MPPINFPRAPWLSTKKHQKNDIFYIGTNMVRVVYLKRRGNHEIAVGTAVNDLPRHQQPTPPPQLITPLSLADTGVGTPRCRLEKGSTPKNTQPPPPCTTHRSKRRQTQTSKTLPPVIYYRYRSRSSIQWLYPRHRFVRPI